MEKSVLNLSLRKLAEGDLSVADKVCSRLSNRLIYVPAVLAAKGTEVKFEARKVELEGGRMGVPLFTTEKLFKGWVRAQGYADDCLSVLGADFCAALDVHTPVLVDPGAAHQVVIEPELIDEIAATPIDDEMFLTGEDEPGRSGNEVPATAVTSSTSTHSGALSSPSRQLLSDAPAYQHPSPSEDGVVAGPGQNFRKTSGAIQSPVILSSAAQPERALDEGDQSKKKSFLNFLKSAKA